MIQGTFARLSASSQLIALVANVSDVSWPRALRLGLGASLLLTVSAGYLYIKSFLFVSKSPVRCKLCFRLSSSVLNPSLLCESQDWTKNAKKTQLQNSMSIFMLSRWLICYAIMIHPAVSMSSLKLKHLLFQAQSFIILHSASGDVFCGRKQLQFDQKKTKKTEFQSGTKIFDVWPRAPPAVKCKKAIKVAILCSFSS